MRCRRSELSMFYWWKTITQAKELSHNQRLWTIFLWINSCQEVVYFCFYFTPDIRYHFVIYAENTLSQILFLQKSTLWVLGIKSFKDSHLFIHLYEVIYNCILTYSIQIMDNAFDSHLFDIGIGNKIATFDLVFYYWLCYFFVVYYYWINDWMESFIKTDTKQKQMNYNCIRK